MATTLYATGNALAVKVWAKKLFEEALKQTYFARFMGEGTDNIVQIKKDVAKGPGDRITVGLRMQLTGAGVQGDNTLEGNEEALTTYSDNVYIDQLRHAVRSAGKMSEQRVTFDVREEARMGLQDWWADRLDSAFFNQICGNVSQGDTRYTGNQATIAPDAAHIKRAAGASDQSITTTGVFSLSVIDKSVEAAATQVTGTSAILRPINYQGQAMYAAFLHPIQVTDLRTNTNTGQFLDIQKAAMTGGEVDDNPIFTGALGVYNNVVLHSAYRVGPGCNSSTSAAVANTRRAVLCGAQAAVLAYGQNNADGEMTWVEELFDFGNQLGVSAGMIFGMKKTVFNAADFATIIMTSYAAAH